MGFAFTSCKIKLIRRALLDSKIDSKDGIEDGLGEIEFGENAFSSAMVHWLLRVHRLLRPCPRKVFADSTLRLSLPTSALRLLRIYV
jgi:hypothetical protein